MSQVTCYLTGCTKRAMQDSVYCTLLHASDAVVRGEAEACIRCHKLAKTPGFPTCSKLCGGLLAIEKMMSGISRQPTQSKTSALVSSTPTIPQPAVKANKAPKNVLQNDISYPCGCVIRILKMSPGASAPGICPACPPPIRKESSTQTDSNDEPKTTTTAPTDTGSAVNTDPLQQTSLERMSLSYTCGCVARGMNLPSSCPICVGTGVIHPVSVTGLPSGSQVPPVSQSSSSEPIVALRQEGSPTSRHLKRSRRGGHRTSSPITRGGSPAHTPVTSPGLDLAAELDRTENEDILEARTKPAGQVNTSAAAVEYAEVQALRSEVKALKDANKALSLYASKVIDRVIAQEGFERVLAVDHEPSLKEDNPHPSGSLAANSSTPNVSTESTAGKPTRRALSMDWKGLTNLFGEESSASLFGVKTDDLLPQGREQQFRMNPETTLVENDNTGTPSVYDG